MKYFSSVLYTFLLSKNTCVRYITTRARTRVPFQHFNQATDFHEICYKNICHWNQLYCTASDNNMADV